MIIPGLLSKIYTDDIYLVSETEKKDLNAVSAVKITDSPKKEIKAFEHLVLSDIEPTIVQKELLEKILQAVGLDMGKVKLITGIEFPDQIRAVNLISFNVSNSRTSAADKYKVLESDSGKILLSDSLAVLETDVSRKKALWQALQKMYGK